jgi:hypothetical protein
LKRNKLAKGNSKGIDMEEKRKIEKLSCQSILNYELQGIRGRWKI